jgi:endo-1,3(4)-beta-glucanase
VVAVGLVCVDAVRVKVKRSGGASLLDPVDIRRPNELLHPPMRRTSFQPANMEIEGPKQTNKFWGNWVVDNGQGQMSIYPSPYTLRFEAEDNRISGLNVFKGETEYGHEFITTPWSPDFVIGAAEPFQGSHVVVKEELFGIHAQLRATNCKATFPVYAGMAFASARYEGACTPRIWSQLGVKSVKKVRAGVWSFQKNSSSFKEYRVYLLTPDGDFVDNSFEFDSQGMLNKQLDGWVRLADVQQPGDVSVLDLYANTVVVGWDLHVEEGIVQYKFDTVGPVGQQFLHWAYANHMAFLIEGGTLLQSMTRTRSPVKGKMFPLACDKTWTLAVDLTEALAVDFLPSREPREEHVSTIIAEVDRDWQMFKHTWRSSMFKSDYYFSGKGFQKIGNICLMLAKFHGHDHADVQECAEVLKAGFQCMYQGNASDGSCAGAPEGTYYDEDWGGLPTRWVDPNCWGQSDFGNWCFNDHHYHYGYFVVAGAMLVELIPAMKDNVKFVDFVEMFIRDVGNPSRADPYFPRFRAFDWFDMHSWSRGLLPEAAGKDQESTSEEVNFHYGLTLWGRVIGKDKMMKLGATMMTLASRALQDYFLMKRDNPHHPANFSLNHVTGIFFQNTVRVTTWFGHDRRFIHGIQMMPLSDGLLLSRKSDFCQEEWDDILSPIGINTRDPWWSVLLSGNLALFDPARAWSQLVQFNPHDMDDGLTKSWALYWTSIQEQVVPVPVPAPTPAPTPTPTQAPAPAPPSGPPSGIMCNPNLQPPQFCPGQIQCPQCGLGACECPR